MAKKITKVAAAVLLLAALAGALIAFEKGAGPIAGLIAPAEASPLESYTGFALKLSLAAGLGSKNTAVSPFSVYPALLMLSEGAAGDTKTEILSALGLSSQEDAREWFKSSAQRFLNAQPPAKTSIANSVWVKSGVPVRESFVNILEKRYSAESYSFSDAADATARINSWVYNKTNGMIDKIIEYLDRSAAIVLVNTVYLKANWTTPFETVINDVFNSPKGPVQAEYLSGEIEAKLLESDDYIAVALSYAGTDVKFVALMPKKASLEEFASKLSEKDLLNVLSSVLGRGSEKVKLLMPKFDVDSGIVELRPILEGIGVRRVFDPERADLSEMLDYSKLAGKAYVSNVFHRARVKVDLYGTEAAAATAVVVKVTAARPENIKTVRIDRPFLFFLVDPTSSAVLFAGSFVEP
jgi:serine protease inhibitor